jgi:hypothetical protein
VNYGIGWSEASDANLLLVGAKRVMRTTLQRSGLQKYKKLRVTCYDRFKAVEAAPVYWAEFPQKRSGLLKIQKSLVTCYDRFEAGFCGILALKIASKTASTSLES